MVVDEVTIRNTGDGSDEARRDAATTFARRCGDGGPV
jgi:hypothetical protein